MSGFYTSWSPKKERTWDRTTTVKLFWRKFYKFFILLLFFLLFQIHNIYGFGLMHELFPSHISVNFPNLMFAILWHITHQYLYACIINNKLVKFFKRITLCNLVEEVMRTQDVHQRHALIPRRASQERANVHARCTSTRSKSPSKERGYSKILVP